MIARGRKFLIAEQRDDGSWPETTPPAGQRQLRRANLDGRLVHDGLAGNREPITGRFPTQLSTRPHRFDHSRLTTDH